MKKILLFGIILLNIINLYSQDIIDPARLFDKTNTNWQIYPHTYLNMPSYINNENKFILAWNWGSIGEKLDSALLINYWHGGYSGNQSNGTPNMNYIDQIPGFSSGHMHYAKLNSMAIEFDPTIKGFCNK